MASLPSILFVGVGSPHGDDRIGWQVADILDRELADQKQITVRKLAVPLDLFDWLGDCEALHVCDAADSDAPIGTIVRIESTAGGHEPADWPRVLPRWHASSSHGFSLAATLQLAKQLAKLPPRVVVHAVSASRVTRGTHFSSLRKPHIQQIAFAIQTELMNA